MNRREDIDLSLIKQYYVEAIKAVRDIRPDLPILMHDSFRYHTYIIHT